MKTIFKFLINGYIDYQYGTEVPDNAISFEQVKNKTELKKLLKNKENYGEYFID